MTINKKYFIVIVAIFLISFIVTFSNPWFLTQFNNSVRFEKNEEVFFVGNIDSKLSDEVKEVLKDSQIVEVDGKPAVEVEKLYVYAFDKETITLKLYKDGEFEVVTIPISNDYSVGGSVGIETSHIGLLPSSKYSIIKNYVLKTLQFKTDYPLVNTKFSFGVIVSSVSLYVSILSAIILLFYLFSQISVLKK